MSLLNAQKPTEGKKKNKERTGSRQPDIGRCRYVSIWEVFVVLNYGEFH